MAGTITVKLYELLRSIGVDVSQQSGSNVKTLATKNKSTATKPGLLAGERDTGGNFGTVLDIFKKEAQYIDGMNDVEKMSFLNNIMDYKEFGGSSIKNTEGIRALDEAKNLTNESSDLKTSIDELLNKAKSMKDEAELNVNKAYKDLDDFFETGGDPFKKKDDKFLGGSMSEEGQIRTGIRIFLQKELKNGRIKLNKLDKARVMEYFPTIADDPILVFKKIYGDEAYKKAGSFPGAFDIGENYNQYEEIFRKNMGEDTLKVKDKKYVGDGTLTLTDEVKTPTPDDDVTFATGGRASFAGGKVIDELILMITKKEPMEAMKEVNKIIGKKGKYKNLTQKDIDRIVDQTNDHIFQRDPDNLFVEDRPMFKKETDEVDLSQGMIDLDELNFTSNAKAAKEAIDNTSVNKEIKEGVASIMSDTSPEALAKSIEIDNLMLEYPGMDRNLADQIASSSPTMKADMIAMVEQTFKMSEQGMSGDDIIQAFKNTPRTKQADGGITRLRNGYYGGGQAMVGEDLSQIGHGSDSLMARNMQLAPNSMATTSTGLNYLLGEDNDTVRVPYNEGNMVLPKAKPTQSPLVELSRIYKTYEEAMPGVSKDTQQFLRNDFIQKLQDAKISINDFMTYRMQNNLADGGRIGFQDGLNFKKFYENKLEKSIDKMLEKETEEYKPMDISAEGEKILKEKFNSLTPNETEKEKEERKMFEMVEEFKTLKKKGIIRPDLSFRNFQKMKEQRLVKNKILELDIKYPEKEIINKETGALNEKNLKSAIDQAQVDLEISPIDGLKLKRFINTEGEQSVTGGEYTTGNFNFSSDNIEEGKLTSKGNFNFGGIDLSGMVNSNDGEILNTELGFNYDNALKGKMTESDGDRSGKLELDKNFTLPTETKFGYKTMFTPKNKKLKNVIDNFDFGIKGKYDISSFDGQTYKSSDLTPKLSYNDGILSADISKEIMDGGNFNLNAGASFPINQKTFTGDLILDANGEPTYNSDGSLKRKQSYNTDMGVVTLKGTDLFTDNMGGTVGYEKTFGDKEGDLFFTGGAEKNIFDDGYTVGAGLKYKFADGGIAGLRKGYAGGGKGVDLARRGFLKFLGGTAAGVAALKAGLVKILGKESGAVSKKVIDEVIIDGGSGAPAWLQPLVNKALREGTDISKQAIKDGQVVKSLDTPTGKVDVYYDTRTGEIDIDYIGGNTALGESVNMRYTPGIADEGTKGVKPADEFEATEAIPEGRMNSPDDYNVELGENTVSEVKDLYSDVSELQALGGDKTLINDISVTLQKKKVLKQMNENPDQFASDNLPDYDPT